MAANRLGRIAPRMRICPQKGPTCYPPRVRTSSLRSGTTCIGDWAKYDNQATVLWVEARRRSVASGFSQHGIPPLRGSGDQHVHAEGNRDEPKHLRLGIYAFEPACGAGIRHRSCIDCEVEYP